MANTFLYMVNLKAFLYRCVCPEKKLKKNLEGLFGEMCLPCTDRWRGRDREREREDREGERDREDREGEREREDREKEKCGLREEGRERMTERKEECERGLQRPWHLLD